MRLEDCEYCDGKLRARRLTEVARWKGKPVFVESVPARVCDRCGERYYSAGVLERLRRLAMDQGQIRRRVSVPITRFSA